MARAPNDGYTLLYDATAQSVNPSLFAGKLPYDTQRDLLPIVQTMQTPVTLVRNAQFAAKTIPELIALAKSKPGSLDCASTGVGTVQHVSLELLNQQRRHQDQSRALQGDGLGRGTTCSPAASRCCSATSRAPWRCCSSKDVTCMAHTGPKPIEVLPGVPGIAEVLPGFETWEWNGVFAPAGTDAGADLAPQCRGQRGHEDAESVAKRLAELGALTQANTVGGVHRLPRDSRSPSSPRW